MLYVILAGFIIALLSPLLYKLLYNYTRYVLSAYAAGIFFYFLTYIAPVTSSNAIKANYSWIPQLSINLNFYIDGLSLFFVLLISGFGSLIILYAGSYLKGHPQLGRFYLYLLLFMNSMLGLVLAGNIMTLFVFWELTSLSSYLLISFDHENGISRASAFQAMFVTVGGGLVMLAGFILIGNVTGTFLLPDILQQKEILRNSPFYSSIVVLVLIGAFTKSAQFPFHFWLPNAMAAPTPVSAYLHSATMVKAGVYLIARLNPALGGTVLWETLLIVTGAVTMILGAFMAMKNTDLKKVLAYTTVSALGMLFLMLGVGTPYAIQACLIFILAHALYKGTLFLITGNLDHQTGSRNMDNLSGLRKKMPYTAFAAILACFSMSGVIPFIGFIGKELIYEAVLNATFYNILLLVAVFISSVIFTALAIEIGYGIFFGSYRSPKPDIKEAYLPMLIGPLIISASGLIFGLFPETLAQPLLNISAIQVLRDVEILRLSLWHGFNLILLLSLLTLLLGFLLYRFRAGIRKVVVKASFIERYGPAALYEKAFAILLLFSHWLTRKTQSGYLRYYILIILSTFLLITTYVLIFKNLTLDYDQLTTNLADFYVYELIICFFIIAGIVLVLITNSRLTALASMGVVGYGIAVIFIFFSAPDAAITQFLVETLTVVLFVLVLHKLPLFKRYSGKREGGMYLAFSILFGCVMTYLLLLITMYPLESELKNYFGENSYTQGHGRNIVNVILVDFRALDTLGESVVLAIAAIGIFTLLKLRLDKEEQI